jgi:hypothetical protein
MGGIESLGHGENMSTNGKSYHKLLLWQRMDNYDEFTKKYNEVCYLLSRYTEKIVA